MSRHDIPYDQDLILRWKFRSDQGTTRRIFKNARCFRCFLGQRRPIALWINCPWFGCYSSRHASGVSTRCCFPVATRGPLGPYRVMDGTSVPGGRFASDSIGCSRCGCQDNFDGRCTAMSHASSRGRTLVRQVALSSRASASGSPPGVKRFSATRTLAGC
jgi:hypothetical protein